MRIIEAHPTQSAEIRALLATRGWAEGFRSDLGTTFVAFDGEIVGLVQSVKTDDTTIVLDNVLVREDRRREGVGTKLVVRAVEGATTSAFAACREEAVGFYESLGFEVAAQSIEGAPDSVQRYWAEAGNRAPIVVRKLI